MTDILHLPLSDIDDSILPRDRRTLDPDALHALYCSILSEGLRQPIEVFPLEGDRPWGLVSGFRRLTVFRQLAADLPKFATVPALIRQPGTIPGVLKEMVTENEIREAVSPWEKALFIFSCIDGGHFDTPDAAIDGLFPYMDRMGRSRLRAVVTVATELQEVLVDGPAWSLRQLLRLSNAIKAGFGEVMETALKEHHLKTQASQWDLLQNILAEADLSLKDPTLFEPPPKRLSRPHPRGGLTIRREWLPNGWRLVFTGPEAKGMMIEDVLKDIERMYGPPT